MQQEQENLSRARAYCYELGNRLSAKYGTKPGQRAAWNETDQEYIQAVASVQTAQEARDVAFRANEAEHQEKLRQVRERVSFAVHMSDERNGL